MGVFSKIHKKLNPLAIAKKPKTAFFMGADPGGTIIRVGMGKDVMPGNTYEQMDPANLLGGHKEPVDPNATQVSTAPGAGSIADGIKARLLARRAARQAQPYVAPKHEKPAWLAPRKQVAAIPAQQAAAQNQATAPLASSSLPATKIVDPQRFRMLSAMQTVGAKPRF